MALPILITLPHCSGDVPPEIFARMRECGEPEADLRRRIFSEGDPFTDRIYDLPASAVLSAPFSRFTVDLNRARDEGGPNGVVKATDFQMRPLYAPDHVVYAAERERRLRAYYDPFHGAVDQRLRQGGIRLLLDGHSMTGKGPALGPDAGKPRPALCLCNLGDTNGHPPRTQPVSLDPALARAARDHAAQAVAVAFPHWPADGRALLNDPFEGGHILRRYTDPAYPARVPGLMLEINRALYLDEEKLEPLLGAVEAWRKVVAGIVEFLIERLPAP